METLFGARQTPDETAGSMRYSLRSLVIFSAVLPPLLAVAIWCGEPLLEGAGWAFGRLTGTTCSFSIHDAARSQIALLSDAVGMYRVDTGELPSELDQLIAPPAEIANPAKWAGPYVEKTQLPVDPWNSAYQYEVLNRATGKFRIWSKGPDTMSRTSDDICCVRTLVRREAVVLGN